MPGINFKDLPTSLQQTLRPYIMVAGSVENAVALAKQQGKWTAENEQQYTALNGGKAWGVFDGFTKQSDMLAQEVAKDPYKGIVKAGQKALANDIRKHPDDYYVGKKTVLPSGNSMAYYKDSKTGNDVYKFYDANGKEIPEKAFQELERLYDIRYDKTSGQFTAWKAPEESNAKINPLGLLFPLHSCSDKDDITEYNFYKTDNYNLAVEVKTLSDYKALYEKQIELLEKIEKNTGLSAEELAALKEELKEINKKLDQANKNLVTIITNQEQFANTAEEYYKIIIDSIGDNNDLVGIVIDKLTESNDTLANIRILLEENNADNKAILEAITKVKFSVDKINENLEKLPDNLEEKFRGHLQKILAAIVKNGDKLDALTTLLAVVNANILDGNKQQQEAAEKILAALEKINFNMTSGMNSILNAIQSGNTKVLAKLDDIIALLNKMDKNDEERNNKVLQAIADHNASMVEGFDKLIKIGNDAKGVLDEILKAIKNIPGIDVDINEIIKAINDNGQKQRNILTQIQTLLAQLNGSVETLDKTAQEGYQAIIKAIKEKVCSGVDLSKVLAKLDEILAAIKDHKVIIKVCSDGTTHCEKVDEGTREDLEWLLGE